MPGASNGYRKNCEGIHALPCYLSRTLLYSSSSLATKLVARLEPDLNQSDIRWLFESLKKTLGLPLKMSSESLTLKNKFYPWQDK